jgi:staphylococcal nuclease domain-containing protein 1
MDRGGNFIGRLTTSDGQSAALMLVQEGLAKVHDSAHNAPDYKQLLEAEEKCRKDRTGVWTNYEESVEKENEEETHPEGRLTHNLYGNVFVFYCRGKCQGTRRD